MDARFGRPKIKNMSDPAENFTKQSAAFQKIWLESMSKLMQAAFTFTPDSAPPELLRQIRNGMLQALAGAWDEFLRSPQFQASMKQWMEQAVAFRKMSNDFMSKARKAMQAPTSGDVEAIMLSVRHMETRILDRVEELSRQVHELQSRAGQVQTQSASPRRAPKNLRKPLRGKKRAERS